MEGIDPAGAYNECTPNQKVKVKQICALQTKQLLKVGGRLLVPSDEEYRGERDDEGPSDEIQVEVHPLKRVAGDTVP